MRQHRLARLAVPITAAALALSACGSQAEEGDGDSAGGTNAAPKVAKIALIAPLTGDLSALGTGIKNSIQLAVDQANAANKIDGWTLEFAPNDDQGKADEGARVATRLTSDPQVVGVIGTLNSSVAQSVQPVLDRANIAMISPANTNPTLTQGDNPAAKARPYDSYFRVATTDAIQGPFAAQYAKEQGLLRVAVVNDKKAYGQGLSSAFKEEMTKQGGTIVADETINPGDKDFAAVISKLRAAQPQLVYYGGEYPEASLLTSQMKSQGLGVPLMGGDGIYDKTYIDVAKAAAEGDLATSVGAPTDTLPSAAKFVTDYNAKFEQGTYSAYGAYSYDAANVLIEALAKVLPGKDEINESVRQAVVEAVQETNLSGANGQISFDEFGDTTNRVLTVYQVKSGAWAPVKTDSFK